VAEVERRQGRRRSRREEVEEGGGRGGRRSRRKEVEEGGMWKEENEGRK
jgi:hypothetical protein